MRKTPAITGAAILLVLSCVFGGFRWGRKWAISRIKPQVDTLVVYKWKEAKIEPFVLETTLYTMPYFIFLRDSAEVADSVAVPVVEREYRDSNYVAVVSGPKVFDVGPVLTSLQMREQVRYITQTVTIEKKKWWSVGPYVGMGCTYANGKFGVTPTVGVALQLSLFSW